MAPGAPPQLVLLHDLGGGPRLWDGVRAALGEAVEAHAPGLPGHHAGPVPLGTGPMGVTALVTAAERRLVADGLAGAHLAGVGLGGLVALALARRGHGASVTALAPLGSWGPDRDLRRLLKLLRAVRGSLRSEGAFLQLVTTKPRVRRATLRTSMEHADRLTGDDVLRLQEDAAACLVFEDVLASLPDEGRLSPGEPLEIPVRLVWGDKDRLVPVVRYGRQMRAALDGAEVTLLRGAGHLSPIDDPEGVAALLREVVATPSPAGPRSSG